MVISKSNSRMDYWREYFGSANVNIFEIIERSIIEAASDFPKEFITRRDGIAQILFSSRLIKCSGCNKEELALPVDNQEHDDHHHDHDDDGGDDDDKGNKYKSSKLADDENRSKDSSRIDGDNDDDEDDDNDADDEDDHVELNQVSKYSYGDAEALTDAIEQESQFFDEVLRIKEIVDNSQNESVSALYNSLRKLQYMALSVETLKATQIGISVNGLRRHSSKDVCQLASSLIDVWKSMVDKYVIVRSKTDVSEANPESMNPSVLDEEEGLPSPPLDDFEFLNTHSMPLELSAFFDGMDDNGNPRKSGESNKTRDSGGKPPVEKQNVTKWKQQKRSNGPTIVPKEDRDSVLSKRPPIVKPTKPLVANSDLGRQAKPNTDRKLQNPEKPTLPKKPAPPQRKLRSSNEQTDQDKLEATKRKLQERYQEAEKAKRQRTIQVMELHDLPKQVIAPKNQHMRPGNNHNRYWAHRRY